MRRPKRWPVMSMGGGPDVFRGVLSADMATSDKVGVSSGGPAVMRWPVAHFSTS